MMGWSGWIEAGPGWSCVSASHAPEMAWEWEYCQSVPLFPTCVRIFVPFSIESINIGERADKWHQSVEMTNTRPRTRARDRMRAIVKFSVRNTRIPSTPPTLGIQLLWGPAVLSSEEWATKALHPRAEVREAACYTWRVAPRTQWFDPGENRLE